MRKSDLVTLLGPIYTKGPLSRSDLSEMMNLAPSRVGVLIRKALNTKCVIEDGFIPSKGGRRRVLLKPNPAFAKIVGVDIGRARIRIVVTDFVGTILRFDWVPTEPFKGRDHVLGVVHDQVKSCLAQYPDVAAIGVTHSGVIDPASGTVLFWPMVPGWDDTPLRQIVEEAYGLPSFVVGDSVRALAVTEQRFGHGKDTRNFVVIAIGWGIGAAIYVDGHVYLGRNGLAGELGHTTVAEEGETCSCGNRGCLELYSSGAAIVRRVRSELETGVTSTMINDIRGNLDELSVGIVVAAAKSHDRLAERVLSEAGTHLGIALAGMVNMLNPERVILAGTVAQVAGEVLLAPILYSLRQRALPQASKNLPLVVSNFGEEAAAQGMALVAGEGLFAACCRGMQDHDLAMGKRSAAE